jgi:hypothetical protein
MKRCAIFLLAFLLVLSVSNAWTRQRTHLVKKGETLSQIGQKYKVSWLKIQKVNGLKTTRIIPDQKLVIPFTDKSKAKKVRIKKEKAEKKWNPGSAPTKENFTTAIAKLPSYKSLLPWQKAKIYQQVINDKYLEVEIPDGWRVREMTYSDKNGRTRIMTNRRADLSKTGPLKAHLYRVENVPVEFVHVLYCNNMGVGEPIPTPRPPEKPIPPPIPPEEKLLVAPPEEKAPPKEVPEQTPAIQSPPEPTLPPIFKEEKKRLIYEHELDVGTGLWYNPTDNSAGGAWWFAQYKFYLHNKGKDFAGGTLTPVLGAFAWGDMGSNDSGYRWNNLGIGPQAGAMWTGITDSGYPQQVQAMFGTLYEYLHGENSSSGYHKDENHFLLRYYVEYIRRFHPELMWVLYAEGWMDVSQTFTSTWSGDHASNLTRFSVGAKLHKDWAPKWATRLGFQIGYAPENNVFGANIHLEVRYDDWLIFGPSLDYTLISDLAAGIWIYGPFGRVEFHKFVFENYEVYRAGEVKPADKELLEY